jgi:ActR/RegA family two-component response regulator
MGSRLLLVDDNAADLDAMRDAAYRTRFEDQDIVAAGDEQQAFALIEDPPGGRSYQVAVVDLMLTPASIEDEGLRVIARLSARHPRCRIIAVTGKRQKWIAAGQRALRAGACDFIWKAEPTIPWQEVLPQRLALWKGVIEESTPAVFSTV